MKTMARVAAGIACGAMLAVWAMAMPGGEAKSPGEGATRTEANLGVAAAPDSAKSVAAFERMIVVIRNPRCMNCHSQGDFPRQGDDGHPHVMDVRRGPDGKGVTAEKCSTCHQDHNLDEPHLPPGAPNWHLPSAATPMIWQGLTDKGICDELKDPARNGHRSVENIVEHMTTDKLVAWGWNPGPGREPVPMAKDEFSAKVKEWAANGAACPAK
jgi:hypothetical protein